MSSLDAARTTLIAECRSLWDSRSGPPIDLITADQYPGNESLEIAMLLDGKSFDEILAIFSSEEAYWLSVTIWSFLTPEGFHRFLPAFVAASLDKSDASIHMRHALLREILSGSNEFVGAAEARDKRLMSQFLGVCRTHFLNEVDTKLELMALRGTERRLLEESGS